MVVSLYEEGWRQGSVFRLELTTSSAVVEDALPSIQQDTFDHWIVASQDCDLDQTPSGDQHPAVEVRPILAGNPNTGWGIKSSDLRIDADRYVNAFLPRLLISAEVLKLASSSREKALANERALAFKTWLGRRYDRPAVPGEYTELARAISKAVKTTRKLEIADQTHDILMQFGDGDPPRYALYAVVTNEGDVQAVEEWMLSAALEVDPSLGVLAASPEVLTKSVLSLDLIENSYTAALSDITWKKATPRGAN